MNPLPEPSKSQVELSRSIPEPSSSAEWIAIEPPVTPRQNSALPTCLDTKPGSSLRLPSFESAQYDIVLRHQRTRPKDGGGTKFTAIPSRFLHLSNMHEFAGWGNISRITLSPDDIIKGNADISYARNSKTLGQFTASSLAGNAVLGSVFYALPAVVAVSSVYSPISLLIATCIMFVWRPVMEELASALPMSGAPYSYLLNVSSKIIALTGAALLLLDYTATSVVSAATAMAYLTGEVTLPFPVFVGTAIILIIFMLVSLCGLRDSARLALTVLSLHMLLMSVLFIASIIAWARIGNSQLRDNWNAGRMTSSSSIAHQIFNGVCIGVLGLTGFECVPSYAASIKPGRFPSVLRNLHYPAILLNALSMLLLFALVPLETILAGANVLSVLGEIAAGRWLRVWVVVNAVIVLCGGVLTGILGASELLERLAQDRVIPRFFLLRLAVTRASYFSIVCFILFSGIVYASSGASLSIMSKMFSMIWLSTMMLFPISVLLLKFNRGRLPRKSRAPLAVVFLSLLVGLVIIGGNIAIDPTTIGYASAYFIAITTVFVTTERSSRVLGWLFWVYDQTPLLHTPSWSKQWSSRLITLMRRLRRQPVCLLARTDEINLLFHQMLYVTRNEETSQVKLVHFYDDESGLPSELEANWKILDEAFPEITVDLVLVAGPFTPAAVAALSHHLQIPTSLMFISCPGQRLEYPTTDFGTRIITL